MEAVVGLPFFGRETMLVGVLKVVGIAVEVRSFLRGFFFDDDMVSFFHR